MINLLSRFLLSKFVSFEIAIVVAYIVGMGVAFILFKFFAFPENDSNRSRKQEVIRFIVVNLWGLLQTLIVSVFILEHLLPFFNILMFQEEIAHVLALSLLVVTSYIGHKHFTFS